MTSQELVPVRLFCINHNIEVSFVTELHENGLIELVKREEVEFIEPSQLSSLERIVRLHYDLDINLEGIDVITDLLSRMETLQDELMALKNRMQRFEDQKA